MKSKEFTCKVGEKEVSLVVRSPGLQDQKEATKVYNQAFSDAIKARAIVRLKIDDILKEQGLWDETKEQQFTSLQREILEKERQLAKGGIPLTKARDVALEMKKLRDEMRELISVRSSLDNNTAEGQADNARFNYLVSACTVYKDSNKPYFNSMEDYLNRMSEEVGIKSAQNLANLIYGLDNDFESNLPENKFLKQYKFVDENLRLIDKQGRFVDREGRLIDADGRYINEAGEFVDKFGYRIDDKGDYVLEKSPFLDDDGNPIVEETKKDEEPPKTEEAKTEA